MDFANVTANPNATLDELLTIEQRFIPSQDLVISCGCVVVDPAARKVALLRELYGDPDGNGRRATFVQLPKGRKDIGESLHAAALREASEETGLAVTALPLRTPTRATVSRGLEAGGGAPTVAMIGDVVYDRDNCEPSSVCAYPCRYTGAIKLVFWFAARADAAQAPALDTREPWENFELEWVDARDAAARMTVPADGKVVDKVLTDMRTSGYDI